MGEDRIAIVGIGEVPTGRDPDRSRWDILYEVCMQAINDAGIDKNDVEGVVSVSPQAQPRITGEIAFGKIPEELGLKGCRDICICNAGGAGTSNCLRLAEQYINSGLAKIVLVPQVTIQSDIPLQDLINFFGTSGVDLQWEVPYGTTYNGSMGLITKRYMYETGTSEEEMASVVVALRKWAALDPHSMFYNKPLTLEDVLNSKMVSTPLHAKECNVLADGGGAMVVTSASLAKEITDTPVYELGHSARFLSACPVMREDYLMRVSFRDASKEALDQAGITKDDLDIVQTYLAYPFGQLIMLEALGICEIGEAGKFFMDGHTSPGGKMPCSTIGDAIGRGHAGSGVSMANYIECARQLMGKAGERQVPDCKHVLSTASGGSCMNAIVTIWGRELS
jgi:acetyl-CoA C-acetyltransferase